MIWESGTTRAPSATPSGDRQHDGLRRSEPPSVTADCVEAIDNPRDGETD